MSPDGNIVFLKTTRMHLTVSSNETIFYNSSTRYEDSRNITGNGLSSMDYFYTILTAVTSGLSIVGGVCICCLYYAFKDIRTPGRKLLLFLAISDAMLAFGNLLGVIWYLYSDSYVIRKNPFYCKFQSAMTIYFSNTVFFWTVIMGVCLFVGTVLKNPTFTVTYMRVFHVLTWIPPGNIWVLPLFHSGPESHELTRIDKYLDSWLNRTQYVMVLTDSHCP